MKLIVPFLLATLGQLEASEATTRTSRSDRDSSHGSFNSNESLSATNKSSGNSVISAQPSAAPPPKHRIQYQSITLARVFPDGARTTLHLKYTRRLFARSGEMWKDNGVRVVFTPSLTPAFAILQGRLELQPFTIFKVWGGYRVVPYFGNFRFLQSYKNANADYSVEASRAAKKAKQNYSIVGQELEVGSLVILPFGNWISRDSSRSTNNAARFHRWRILARSETMVTYRQYPLRNGDRYFYDALLHALVPGEGWTILNNTDLVAIFEGSARLTSGLRSTVTHAFMNDITGLEPTAVPTHLRIGPLFAWTFHRKPSARKAKQFADPTVFFMTQWQIIHPWHRGKDANGHGFSAALPTTVAGFSFSGTLWAN